LFAALFTLVLVQAETAPVVAVAVIVGSFMIALIALFQVRSKTQVQTTPQNAAP
jgi:type III secretory pathway component EscS